MVFWLAQGTGKYEGSAHRKHKIPVPLYPANQLLAPVGNLRRIVNINGSC
jgi:hypothetical protein